ncbi:MAG: YdcF family protein, partial [Muribaculaceae bacterium]|nr:YdcF family protein [Muribaculaceae bacterium]
MIIATTYKTLIKRGALFFGAFLLLVVAFTIYANIKVESAAGERIYMSVDSIPHNKVALLLGTNPLNRLGRPNSYFTNRINTAAELYHAGKVDFIIASGDNHIKHYDEPTAMRDSLVAHGVPEDRIILDFAGFRTLDSVVRAKEVFGCDSLTIISQADHNARALYIAGANGIAAVAVSAPLRAGRWVRMRLALREWLARDKMMLDIWFGKKPHFLGEKIGLPDMSTQKSYSTAEGMTMRVVGQDVIKSPVDSLIVEFTNSRDAELTTGEWYRI